MEPTKKLNAKELESVTGGGAIYNCGNISNPDKIYGSETVSSIITPKGVSASDLGGEQRGNHEFNYGIDGSDER